MKRSVLIVGAGGVAQVAAHKCAQNNDILGDIHIASRTLAKCEKIIASIREKGSMKVEGGLFAHKVNARDKNEMVALLRRIRPQIVINLAQAFVNMPVLDACIEEGVAYMDTAIHEEPDKICETPPWYGNYEWKRRPTCAEKGITAILGVGFDPGVVNAYARFGIDHFVPEPKSIDIVDVNAGSHGRYFATNFDPEINFREFTGRVYSWQNGRWQENKMFEIPREWDLPVVGKRKTYMTGHDEIHSLATNYPHCDVRFWMGFSDHYVNVFTVLKSLGLLSEQPVRTAEGLEVVPLKVVKAVLPDPASLAPDYTGKTCIGTLVRGTKNGEPAEVFTYNVCDHRACYLEVGSQAISYTAGVPPVAAAILITQGIWDVKRMVNVEELPPEPFLEVLDRIGLPSRVVHEGRDLPWFEAIGWKGTAPQIEASAVANQAASG